MAVMMFRVVRKSKRCCGTFFLFLLCIASLMLLHNSDLVSYDYQSRHLSTQYEIEIAEPEIANILLWTPWFGYEMWFFDSNGSSQFMECSVSLCSLTSDRSYINTSTLVLFHWRDFDDSDLPERHVHGQSFVFMSMESPMNTDMGKEGRVENEMFDMTMTYMRRSDVVIDYGDHVKRVNPLPPTNYAQMKSKGVLMFVSNCYTEETKSRLNISKSLRRYIDVDIYGDCGDPDPCKGTNDMVPIVMGASIEEYQKVAPPNSFIHMDQFASFEELAVYLLYLTQNSDAYNKHMDWKRNFTVRLGTYKKDVACQLCSQAHQKSRSRPSFSLRDWWNRSILCSKYPTSAD
ncbi:hypothetical protein CAPTEDRAFT_200127 [Capitella teleta]|uniref:Fucosyltransferase n=1 Tax=Capitella teleta TaxID=283909 RepID=R7V3E1_CAPTE|nr:hypothetical protein CAPTEDRAFT_200127 [Capitella teleta]|eukprot:ELU13069.1 hypothetical protein CAPTEDRAFT_200127 [Capitella teleta]